MPTQIVFVGGNSLRLEETPQQVVTTLRATAAFGTLKQLGEGSDAVFVNEANIAFLEHSGRKGEEPGFGTP
jgi:hypothetical protein